MIKRTPKDYLVDSCHHTHYYKSFEKALIRFYNDEKAHTLAKQIDGIWYPIREKIIGKPEPIRVKMNDKIT